MKKGPKRKSRSFGTLMSLLIIIVGIGMCFAPTVLHLYLSYEAQNNVSQLTSEISKLDPTEKQALLEQAFAYNAFTSGQEPSIPVDDIWEYNKQLSLHGSEAIGAVEIPKASINMTLYHGVGEPALSAGIGHEDWSMLPIGGVPSHCVIAGHSGMRQLRVFDGIRCLEKGDKFIIWVLGDPYAYEVDNWEIIDPADFRYTIGDRDEVTLVTCTTTPDNWNPKGAIGINDKRLLVHAYRIDYDPTDFEDIAPDLSVYVNDNTRQAWIAAGILILLGLVVFVSRKLKKKKNSKTQNDTSLVEKHPLKGDSNNE